MSDSTLQDVIQVVSCVTRRQVTSLGPESRLSDVGLSASLGLSLLRSALERRFGATVGVLSWQLTIDDVCSMLNGSIVASRTPLSAAPTLGVSASLSHQVDRALPWHAQAAPSGSPVFGIGIDLEAVAGLPEARNLRDDEFYSTHFDPTELSHALLQPDPREHLCGLFCAKEALKKAVPDFVSLRMDQVIVSHTAGRPVIRLRDGALDSQYRFDVSISHAGGLATAVVLAQRIG